MIALTSADSLQAYTQHLQDYQSRYRRLDNRFEISAWILSKFEQYGFTNCSYQEYELQSVTQRNVIATIPGSVNPDTYVLIGAHYDSITNSQPMVFAPGADDNASGTAGLLEMARIMKAANFQPDCSIRFIAISAEEGLGWGSDHYCQTAIAEGQDIRLMLNMDMIACSEEAAGEFLIHPYEGFLYHCDEAVRISELYSVYQPAYGTFNGTSDSIIFYEYGFPAVFFKERYLNQRLHTNNDLIIYLDFDYAAEILRASTATAAVYSQKPMPVESLTVSVVGDSETLLAEWDAISDPSVLSYRVYCGTHIDSLQFYEETTDTFCEVAGLTDGELHYVAISTVDGEANTGNRCAGSGTPRLLPLCPASFSESPALGSITLSWSPNHELDLQGYRIYRSIDPQENGELLTDMAAIDSLYIDTDFPNAYETYYYYRILAYDTQDNASELSEPISSRPVSLIQSILIVDETRNSPGTNPFLPDEIAVENFYAECFAEFSNVSRIDLEELGTNLRLADIGIYSTMFWHANDNTEVDYPFYIRDDIERYIQLGGKVLFSQYFPGKAFELSAGYPATFPEDSFINRVLGIAGADYHVGARFKYALPLVHNLPVLQVDSLKTIASWEGHSFGVETIQPGNSDEAKYSYASDYDDDSSQGQLNGGTIGILHPYGEGLAFCLSFPLFNMQIDGAKNLIEYVFEHLFGVPTAAPSAELTAPEALTLCANFPNPFNEKTSFTIFSRDTQSPVSIDVYNLKGQRVMQLYQGEIKEETELIWDGKDFRGRACASGIYFLRANQSGHIVTRKVLLLKTP